ncbi:BTAD domain-containing putative transcriptional regulator [Kutzneria sp. NPDC052558]|uniref:AfsR/SARP family transcriptional regulator n=1 Tax=Kutzneria sp. NPDC052558 TaxID=3364121 RepID=UPI0037CBB06C
MHFRLLGPVCAVSGDTTVELSGRKPRALVALLAVNAGHVVPIDVLIDALWGEEPPDSARAGVHSYVSTLRRTLGEGVIMRRSAGYELAVPPERVDVHVFTRKVAQARQALAAERFAAAAQDLTEALELWRGPALGGVDGDWAERERSRLGQLRLAALEDRIEADLRLGRGPRLIAELTALVDDNPLRERPRWQLMLALYQAGRQAEALEKYESGRRLLVDELGVEPSPEFQAMHGRILRGEVPEPVPDDGPRAETPAPEPKAAPQQLPPDVADFTGREAEIALLSRRLRQSTQATTVCVIAGTAGAGKSSLAVHTAHLVREHFPDGQLYVNLRGVHSASLEPIEVLARFLRALGVPAASIPDGLEERADLYRTLLADRRVLIVLDDAADERHVRDLLPGGSGCAVLVTSRRRLPALAGALHVDLAVFAETEATELLETLIGAERVAREPDGAADIVRLCGWLPLAVRITGARLSARPQWPLHLMATRLRERHQLLDELSVGDLEVRGSLLLSYEGLSEAERRTLRLLGWLGTMEFASWFVAPLLDATVGATDRLLERLADTYLLDTVTVDAAGSPRYQLHDLTRAFAIERAEAEEPVPPTEAVERVVHCAVTMIDEATARMPRGSSTHVSGRPRFSSPDPATLARLVADPVGWFDAERSVFVALVERASELGLVTASTSLAAALSASAFTARNQFDQWWQTHSAALQAADLAGDDASKASLYVGLGRLRLEQDRFDEAADYYGRALAVYERLGDANNVAVCKLELASVLRERGDLVEAKQTLLAVAPELASGGHSPQVQARAWHGLGMVLTELGEFDASLVQLNRALSEYERLADRFGQALMLRSIGITHRAMGDLVAAEKFCGEALRGMVELGDSHMLVYTVQSLAKVRIRQGRGDEEREALLDGLETCSQLQDGFGQALMLRTLGELDLAARRFDDAEQHLQRSLQWWTALAAPLGRARTLRDLATLFAATGRAAESETTWQEALRLFERHHAREAREQRPWVADSAGLPG